MRLATMSVFERYITSFLISILPAYLLSVAVILILEQVVSGDNDIDTVRYPVLFTAFFASLATFTLLLSKASISWQRGIGLRYLGAAFLSLPFALMITWVVDIVTNQFIDQIDWLPKYDDWIGLAAFFASLIFCTLWVLKPGNRHLAISRGCGIFAVALFALLVVAFVDLIIHIPPGDPPFPPIFFFTLFAVIGIAVGAFAGVISWDYRRRDMPKEKENGNESRNWRG